jgi:hypothetical protein
MRRRLYLFLFALGIGCEGSVSLGPAELMDPTACKDCHPRHYAEWSGSMHAYSAEDPVFLAMNARGQRETGGALGDFCVRCHAPMAVRTGATRDGLNLASLPAPLRGVTCYFCHQVSAIEDSHNNPLVLASDETMRGGLSDPIFPRAHRAAYSTLHDRKQQDSASLCGACHDVVTPAGVALERTFVEWKGSLFAQGDPKLQLTCGQCHMPGRTDKAADVADAQPRLVHDHSMPGVDVALTPFPQMAEQRQAVLRDLRSVLAARLCVSPSGAEMLAEVTLDNAGAGHDFPSGASHDRRAFVELSAYASNTLVFSSGAVADSQAAVDLPDPNLWLMRERVYDKSGKPAHMFWDIARYEADHLTPAVTSDPRDPRYFHSVTRSYRIPQRPIDRVTLRVRMRPIDFDVLADLEQSGDLDPKLRAGVPTFTLDGATLEWRSDGPSCVQ